MSRLKIFLLRIPQIARILLHLQLRAILLFLIVVLILALLPLGDLFGVSHPRLICHLSVDNDGLHYVNADVLWITDFLIPDPPQSMLARFKEYRDTGTRFYGIRIVRDDDKEPNTWKNYFNQIYTIKYRPLRRY